MNKSLVLCLGLLFLVFVVSCQAGSDNPMPVTTPLSGGLPQQLELVPMTLGTTQLQVMVARSELEKQTGLMYRTALPANEGMLFCYGKPQIMNFWMKNTRIPLDIVFFSADLRVTESIKGMVPGAGLPDNLVPVYTTTGTAQYALELASGSVDQMIIRPGDRLSFSAPISLDPIP